MALGILKDNDELLEAIASFRRAKTYGGHDTPEALLSHVMPVLQALRDELKEPLSYTDFDRDMDALMENVKFYFEHEIEEENCPDNIAGNRADVMRDERMGR